MDYEYRTPEEIEQDRRTDAIVQAYLIRPKRQPHTLSYHRWQPILRTCVRCGISRLDFDVVEYGVGLPCSS